MADMGGAGSLSAPMRFALRVVAALVGSARHAGLLVPVVVAGCASATVDSVAGPQAAALWDASRGRQVPIALYFPQHRRCTLEQPCPVAFVSPGYGLLHTDYSFVADALTRSGYLVVGIRHDLPTDPPLSRSGDLFASRLPAWQRGAENLRFVRNALAQRYPAFAWSELVLLGHSNGGDISAFALHESPEFAAALVTFDNRRYPLPRRHAGGVLSIRASDFQADTGVLPMAHEGDMGICVVQIAGSRHNDMSDHGPGELQSRIAAVMLQFLEAGRCTDGASVAGSLPCPLPAPGISGGAGG